MYSYFERLLDPYQRYDDSKPLPGELIAFYRAILYPARKLLIASALLGLTVAIIDALMIRFAADLVDMLTDAEPESLWREHGDALLVMAAVSLLLRPMAISLDHMILDQGYFPNMGALIRWRTHRHMLRQSVGFFNDDFAGRIANKQIQLAPAVNDSVYHMLSAIWYALVYVISVSVVFAELDWLLLAPILLWFALFVASAVYFVPRITRAGKEFAEQRSRLAGRIVDSYTNIQTVKLFAHAEREEAYAKGALEDMRRAFARQTRLYSSTTIAVTFANSVLIGGAVGLSVWLWAQDAIGVGAVAAAAALVLRLLAMSDWILGTLTTLFQSIGIVMEGVETVSQPHRMTDAPHASKLVVSKGAIRFERVSHHYGRDPRRDSIPAGVVDVALDIAAGERVGLVGRSGAGKSTLVNLLLRFFDPEAGRVLINGQDIALATQDSLRAQIGMVTQDTSLLHRSILDNILYGAPEADIDAAIAAAKRVKAHEFILDLEDSDGRRGYDAFVGERGVKLSGGQRQRIALARVVLKNAPILVLDEATSALDSEVEAAILEAMDALMREKTVIAIAHRLSTIAQMDRIVVMDEGRIIEQGPHERLLRAGGLYARLWERQSGGFLDLDSTAE